MQDAVFPERQESTQSYQTDDTVPDAPLPLWDSAVPHNGDFARLRPLSELAKEAFVTVSSRLKADPDWAPNARRFVAADHEGTGYYRLNMEIPARSIAAGWVVGTDERTADILLVDPQCPLFSASRVSHRHCQVAFGPTSDALLLRSQPSKEVIVNGCEVIRFEPRVLGFRTGIQIGTLSYIFDYTPDFPQSLFRSQLQQMRERRGWPNPEILPALTPTPGPDAITYRGFHIEKATLSGASATVSFGRRIADAHPVVAKRVKVPNSSGAIGAARNEINNLQTLRHPCIVHMAQGFQPDMRVFNEFETPMQELILVMEPAMPQTLADIVRTGQGSAEESMYLLHDVLSAVTYLHKAMMMHHDLKPANIGVSTSKHPPRAVLLDLGHTRMTSTSRNHTLGTISYLAPEVIALKRSSAAPPYGHRADVWSVGLTFAELLLRNTVSAQWRIEGIMAADHERLLHWLSSAKATSIMTGTAVLVVSAIFDNIERMLVWEQGDRCSAESAFRRVRKAVDEFEQEPVKLGASFEEDVHGQNDDDEYDHDDQHDSGRETKRLRV